MRWNPADAYSVKLEAAELIGYRAVTVCGTREPVEAGVGATGRAAEKGNVAPR